MSNESTATHIKITPPPGHPDAMALGCKCPEEDNNYGSGAYKLNGKPIYWMAGECRIHCGVEQESNG